VGIVRPIVYQSRKPDILGFRIIEQVGGSSPDSVVKYRLMYEVVLLKVENQGSLYV
jgi:hypothetical protein